MYLMALLFGALGGAAIGVVMECRFLKKLLRERQKYWERIKEEK